MSALLDALAPIVAWTAPLVARLSPALAPLFGPGDLELALPQALLVVPLPLLVWALLPPYREPVASVRVPFFEGVAAASGQAPRRGAAVLRRSWLQWLVAPSVWALVVLAAARPEWVEPPIRKTERARDLLLAVDLSQSMETRDFQAPDGRRIDRLEAVKLVLDDFIARAGATASASSCSAPRPTSRRPSPATWTPAGSSSRRPGSAWPGRAR